MHISTISIIAFCLVFISGAQAVTDPESESGLMEHFKRSHESSPDDHEDWVDLTAGLMMQGPDTSPIHNALSKRQEGPVKRETTEILVSRDITNGKIILPRSWSDVKTLVRRDLPRFLKRHAKRGARHAARSMRVMITWYNGHDLLNPSCVQSSSWAPTDSSMVGAVTIAWSNKPPCGRFVKIRHRENNNKWIVVRIMDSCGGCASGSAHIDLTTGAFTKLYDLDVGAVSGLQAKLVKAPKGYKWTKADIKKFGPQKL